MLEIINPPQYLEGGEYVVLRLIPTTPLPAVGQHPDMLTVRHMVYYHYGTAAYAQLRLIITATPEPVPDGGNNSGGSGGNNGDGEWPPETGSDDKDKINNETDTADSEANYKRDKHTAFIIGRANGMFYPDATLTRAEAAQMFYNL